MPIRFVRPAAFEITQNSNAVKKLSRRAVLAPACIVLASLTAAPRSGAESPPKLIEFGAGVEVPARPLPVPEWEIPPPTGVAVETGHLPQTPVPAPAPDAQSTGEASTPAAPNDAIEKEPSVRKKLRFVVRGNRTLPADRIKSVLTPYLYGDDLTAACNALELAYGNAGQVLARVSVTLSIGDVVHFAVIEPRLRSLRLLPWNTAAERTVATLSDADVGVPALRMTPSLRVIRSRATR